MQLFLFLLLSLTLTLARGFNGTAPMVPAVIIFGDSIVDTGNNDVLGSTVIRSDFPPYGIGFPGQRPTGRFCNGKIASDFIASKLGVKELLPPYLGTNLGPEDLLTGVVFASSGTGYDPLTSNIVSVISMPEQLEMFKEYKEKIKKIAGDKRAASIVAESLYVVCAGSDDIANTYFTTPFRRSQYDFNAYSDLMVSSASSFLVDLVHLGARKIGIVGIPPIGCVPSQRTLEGGMSRDCSSEQNELANMVNSKLIKDLQKLTNKLHGVKLIYIDIYTFLYDITQHPTSYGFKISTRGCCGTGNLEVAVLCNGMTSTVCPDVSNYVFWDSYHPTEKTYNILVDWVLKNYLKFLL